MRSLPMLAAQLLLRTQSLRRHTTISPDEIRMHTERRATPQYKCRNVCFDEQLIGGVRCELVFPMGGEPDQAKIDATERGTVLVLHGGGYFFGSPATHRGLTCGLAPRMAMRMVVPDYRLAPEHPSPAAWDDALAVYRNLADQPGPLILAADSAGGGLALATVLQARDLRLRMPDALLLYSPWVDMTLTGASILENRGRDFMVTWEVLQASADWVCPDLSLRASERHSPLLADLQGLPPTLIFADRTESLWSDAERLAAKLLQSGVTVKAHWTEGLIHAWPVFGGSLPEARQAQRISSEFGLRQAGLAIA